MSTGRRWAAVLGGYALSAALAVLAVRVYASLGTGPAAQASAQASAGMSAFGDMLFGLAVFGMLSLVPTAMAAWFLRGHAWLWKAVVAAVALVALLFLGLVAVVATRA